MTTHSSASCRNLRSPVPLSRGSPGAQQSFCPRVLVRHNSFHQGLPESGSESPVCAETPTLTLLRGPTLSHISNQNSEKWEGLVTNHKYTPSTYQLSRTLEWLRTIYYNQRCSYHTILGTQN